MRRWGKRIGIAVAVIALAYFGIAFGAGMVLNWSLTPGNGDWSGGKPTPSEPFEIGYHGDPKTALGLDFQTVSYPTEPGPAEAWLVPAATPSKTWAVYVHGIRGIRENGYKQLSILNQAGISTLMITYRNDVGAPSSVPPYYAFGLTEWRDLDAAIGWALGHGAERIVLVAESMGGGLAGQFLVHSDKTKSVVALMLDAPALDFPAIADSEIERRHLPTLGISALALDSAALTAPVSLSDAVAINAVAAFPGPLFLAHGSGDQMVPVTISDRLVKMRSAPTVYLRTAADHLESFKENPDRYRSEMLAFLKGLGPPERGQALSLARNFSSQWMS